VLLPLVLLVPPRPTAAHSLLLSSSPAAGAVVAAPPGRITLTFNNRVEKALSRVRLLDAGGRRQSLEVAVAEGPPDSVAATVPALAPGSYRVEWQVLSTDGHVVRGAFSFRLQP
jgi:methionine-rich copper-binding protein CopC